MVELLPAPFGPRNPKASPWLDAKSMPSTATKPAKRLVSACASMRGAVTTGDASGRPPRDSLGNYRACARDADVGRAAHAELSGGVDFVARGESERGIARSGVIDVELDAHRAARHRHPAGHDAMEQAVQRCRIVIDDPVPDLAIAVHGYLVRMALMNLSVRRRRELEWPTPKNLSHCLGTIRISRSADSAGQSIRQVRPLCVPIHDTAAIPRSVIAAPIIALR